MFDINKFLKKLTKSSSTSSEPLIKESLERDTEFMAAYNKWCNYYDYRKFTDLIYNQYQLFISENDPYDLSVIRFLKGRGTNGFVLKANPDRSDGYEDYEMEYFFDYLKERILQLSYICYSSDIKHFNKDTFTETIQRHYLKPSIKVISETEPEKANQQWGNFNIELKLIDNKVRQMKFLNTWYSDHNWTKVKDFDGLIKYLFSN